MRRGILFSLLWLCFSAVVCAESERKAGTVAPPLTLKSILQAPSGTRGTWDELKGKAVVIEFWATWCGGCVDNIPHINELAAKFASRPVQFISVTDETDLELVKRFAAEHPMRGWIAFDADERTFKSYGVEARPRTLLVDAAGIVRAITNPRSVTPQVLEDLIAGSA